MNMDKNIPNEEEITELLSQIQPSPSPKFSQKMANRPWKRARSIPSWSDFTPLRAAATLGLVLLLVFGISLLSPSLNTLAQRFTQFFLPSPDSQTGEATAPLETRHPTERFSLTIGEAETLAGFKMDMPSTAPQGFDLIGATYDELREAIILHYTTKSGGLVLRISQQQLDSDYQAIDPEAVVEMVSIGPYTGEFVSGGWMIPEVELGADATQSPDALQAVWDANVKLQTLRWSDGEYLYEIILAGDSKQPGYLDRDDLISLANRMY
jgi:hypothetical protein